MDSNETNVEKSIGYDPSVNTDDTVATCSKPGCSATVEPRITTEDGHSVEYERCANGHRVYQCALDHDGSTYRAFKAFAIAGP